MLSGFIGNQDPRVSNYLVYCHLKHDGYRFVVDASAPSNLRNYICDYEGDYTQKANFCKS